MAEQPTPTDQQKQERAKQLAAEAKKPEGPAQEIEPPVGDGLRPQ